MTNKVHGFVGTPDQSLVGGLPMLTVTVDVDIATKSATTDSDSMADDQDVITHNVALDKLIEGLSTRAQPIIMGTPAVDGDNWTLNFAVEHDDVFKANDGTFTAFNTELSALMTAALGHSVTASVAAFVF